MRAAGAAIGTVAAVAMVGWAPAVAMAHDGDPGIVVQVQASGDTSGVTDQAAITDAFAEAALAGEGSTVALGPGVFYLVKPVQVGNFVGTLEGAGKGVTTLTNPPGRGLQSAEPPVLPPGHALVFYQDAEWPEGETQRLVLRDFTVDIDELPIPWGVELLDNGTVVTIENQFSNPVNHFGRITNTGDAAEIAYVDLHVESVGFEGRGLSGFGLTPGNAPDFTEAGTMEIEYQGETLTVRKVSRLVHPWVWKNMSGSLTVSDCTFDDFLAGGVDLGHGGHPDFVAVFDGNDTVDSSLVAATHFDADAPLDLIGWGNEIRQPPLGFFSGVEVWGPGVQVHLVFNSFHSEDNALFGPIWLWDNHDALVAFNAFSGQGPAAVYIGEQLPWAPDFALPATGAVLLGNHFHGWEAAPAGPVGPQAPIWLGPYTEDTLVVGHGSAADTVLDEGIDNTLWFFGGWH